MSSFKPVAIYGLTVPAGDMPIPAFDLDEYPATFRITMAAIDPSAKPESNGDAGGLPRATLKMIRFPVYEDESDEDEDDEDYDMANLLDSAASDEDDEDDDEEDEPEAAVVNGNGAKLSSKAKKAAAIKKLKQALASEEGMEVDEDEDDEDDEDLDDDEELPEDAEEFVICTLDPTKQYQQTLDITINENEQVLFKVTGNYPIYLTGNIVVDENEEEDSEDDEYDEGESFDLSPDEDELDLPDDEDESDALDDLEDPRVMEVDSEEEAAPKLVKAESKKGKNKRAAEESAENTPVKAAAAATEGDAKLSKSQQKKLAKKLKNNAGNAVDVATEAAAAKEEPSSAKSDKKVQFSKTLIQGPSGSASPKPDAPKASDKPKAGLGVKTVQGVTIDDKKLGSGPVAKKGDKVSMRYIGKLEKDKKVFDSNKKGPPFSFKLNAGQVIRGWDIGIAGMAVGGERRITIPAHLAYGSKSQAGIPANSTLIFDVKMLEIK